MLIHNENISSCLINKAMFKDNNNCIGDHLRTGTVSS